MKKNRGNLLVVSAPSGAGKTTLCKKLMESMPGIRHSVSHTTRSPRPGEVDGRDYIFVDEESFSRMAEAGEFAEWASVHGNLYGTAKRTLDELLESGMDVILDIDVQGAMKLRKRYGGGVYVFILPPSMEALRERLRSRLSDSGEEIRKRLAAAKEEIREYGNYDYVIINDIFDDALGGLKAIVASARLRTGNFEPSRIEEIFLKEDA